MKPNIYNPDVLTCLANLSNDEVFTPPNLANDMLDLLPKELFQSSETTFLDPVSKSGVFLREIGKRLMTGLEQEIPDIQERINHIYTKQLFGIATTELTSLASRRTVYCSKFANGKYSIVKTFNDEKGNIDYENISHTWQHGNCKYCGASKEVYDRSDELESHAYQFIHTDNPQELFGDMKFDVIIGNPPYQLSTGSASAQATPLYNKFVEQAKKLSPRYLTMIIPGRWYAGGMGLDTFRDEMLNDKRIRKLVDYPNASEVFPGIELRGGACYFLWERDNPGITKFTSISGPNVNTVDRDLSEYEVFIRWNQAISIIHKVIARNEETLVSYVSGVSPFGIPTSTQSSDYERPGDLRLYTSKGVKYIDRGLVKTGTKLIDRHKVLVSQLISGNMETPPFKVLSILKTLNPGDVCTHTYITAGCYENQVSANNLKYYLSTKFARFLLAQSISNMHVSRGKFRFVPVQDFSEEWADEKLYKKYGLTTDEVAFIESMIRPMEHSDD